MCILGLGLAVLLYMTAASSSPDPLGYDPFTSKKYVRELELYGGKLNLLAVEFRQWLVSLWRGTALAYTIAVLTLILSSLLWFIASRVASPLEPQAETPQAPSDALS